MTPVTDWYTFGMPTPTYPGPARQSPGTGIQLAMDQFVYELPPQTKTRPGFDRVWDDWPDMPNSVPSHDKLSPKAEVHDSDKSPRADLMDTVAHLQLEVEALKFVQSAPPALAKRTLPVLSNRWHLHPPKCLSSVGELVGISTAKCLTPSPSPMGGTTLLSPYNSCLTWKGTLRMWPCWCLR